MKFFNASIYKKDKFQELTAYDRDLYWYLYSQDDLNFGLVEFSIRNATFNLSRSEKDINESLNNLIEKGYIVPFKNKYYFVDWFKHNSFNGGDFISSAVKKCINTGPEFIKLIESLGVIQEGIWRPAVEKVLGYSIIEAETKEVKQKTTDIKQIWDIFKEVNGIMRDKPNKTESLLIFRMIDAIGMEELIKISRYCVNALLDKLEVDFKIPETPFSLYYKLADILKFLGKPNSMIEKVKRLKVPNIDIETAEEENLKFREENPDITAEILKDFKP